MSMGSGPPSSPDPTASSEPLPPAVLTAAHSRQLGPPVATRKLPNPLLVSGVSVLLAFGSLGLLVLVSWWATDITGPLRTLLRAVALFSCFSFVGLLAYAIAVLVRGAQAFYLFAGGFVHRRNSRVRALAWPEVAELRPMVAKRGSAAGKVQSYQLVARDRKTIAVPLVLQDGRDLFMDQLMAVVARYGIPIR